MAKVSYDTSVEKPPVMAQHSSMETFVATHKGLVVGGGVVAVLLLAGLYMNGKSAAVPATSTNPNNLGGLQNGNIVYVPTSTNFTTKNITSNQSNDPLLTTITGSPVNQGNTTNTSTSTSTTTTQTASGGGTIGGGSPPTSSPPVHTQPPPQPAPKPTQKALRWDTSHTILGGETLSSIAAQVTRTCRMQGMPGNMSVVWNDLYAHNTATVNRYAQAHGFRSDYWNWIFPGEVITVPRWA